MFPWGEAPRAISGRRARRGRSYISGARRPLWPARWCSRVVVLILTGTLLALIPAAHSSPPDPTWIAGLYDDADHDEAILAIIDGTGLVASKSLVISRASLFTARLHSVDSPRPSLSSQDRPVERAPPVRLTSAS